MVISGTYRVKYTNFVAEFMTAMDIAFVSSSICLKLTTALSKTQQLVMEPSEIKEIRTKVLNRIAILQSQKAIAQESFIENT